MNIASLFIRRPVATVLIMLGMLFFGLAGYRNLPVNQLPTVDFPTIQVQAELAGADPETMASSGWPRGWEKELFSPLRGIAFHRHRLQLPPGPHAHLAIQFFALAPRNIACGGRLAPCSVGHTGLAQRRLPLPSGVDRARRAFAPEG